MYGLLLMLCMEIEDNWVQMSCPLNIKDLISPLRTLTVLLS